MMMHSRVERRWLAAGAVAALLVAVIGYFFLIAPKLAQASDVSSQNDSAGLQNVLLQQKINELRTQQPNLARYQAQLQADRAALPTDSGMSDFLRSLQSVGLSTQVQVASLTVGGTAAGVTQSTHDGVTQLPISLTALGTDEHLRAFLTQLQTVQPRAVVVSQATVASGTTNGADTLTLSLTAFTRP